MPNDDKELMDHAGNDDLAAREYFDRIKDKPFAITDPSVPVTPTALPEDYYARPLIGPPPGPPVDPADRHRRYQAFAMFGCKSLWKEEYAGMRRPDVIADLAKRQNHPAVPKVIDCLRNQHECETTLNELPAVAAVKDAVAFFSDRKAKIDLEAKARDDLKQKLKRHQGEIARHEMAMSAYAKSAVEAGVLKPFHAYQAGDYVLVVIAKDGEFAVSMMPLEKAQTGE